MSELAQRLDEDERLQMSENGTQSYEYQRFLEQPSGNMDDTGFFSIQVISRAFIVWGLELIPFNSSDSLARACRANPNIAQAYIFNMHSHWYCIRRFGDNWFNLNSTLNQPEFMSGLYLSEYLKQIAIDGYSIFIVSGNLPECDADKEPPTYKNVPGNKFVNSAQPSSSLDDTDLAEAIQLSLTGLIKLKENQKSTASANELDAAVKLSMECFNDEINKSNSTNQSTSNLIVPGNSSKNNLDELRKKRLAFLSKKDDDN